VDIGLALPQYDFLSPDPGLLGWEPVERAARLAEELGYASLWLSDHLFLDRGRYGGPPGRCPGLDPIPLLSAVARATTRVRLGTLTLCAPFRPATITAKQLATLDIVSGGRLTVGIGAGWYEDEFAVAGIPFKGPGERLAHLEEAVHVLRGMLGGGPFTFDGRYERAAAARLLPLPIQRPGPPIWIGGKRNRLLDLAARVADGWNTVWIWTPDAYRERLTVLHAACDRANRDPATIALSLGLYALVGEDEADLARRFERQRSESLGALDGTTLDEYRRGRLVGTVEQVREQVGEWAGVGVSTIVVSPRPLPFTVPDGDDMAMIAEACRL
jgi:probable F420-dependent oxidoreductase